MTFTIGCISVILVFISASKGDMMTQNTFDRSKPYAQIKPGGDIEFSINDDFLGNVELAREAVRVRISLGGNQLMNRQQPLGCVATHTRGFTISERLD